MKKDKLPKPGSEEAIKKGCKCPVLDNEHGQGWMGNNDLFWISDNCPIHGNKNRNNDKPA